MKKKNFFLAHKQFTLFFILALAVVGVAVFAPWVAPKDPLEAVMLDSLKAPCAEYPLGADKLGRDILSRVIFGTRTSLVSTLILVATIFVVGTILGIIAGYFGGGGHEKASGVTMTGTPQDILNNLAERIDEQLKG